MHVHLRLVQEFQGLCLSYCENLTYFLNMSKILRNDHISTVKYIAYEVNM